MPSSRRNHKPPDGHPHPPGPVRCTARYPAHRARPYDSNGLLDISLLSLMNLTTHFEHSFSSLLLKGTLCLAPPFFPSCVHAHTQHTHVTIIFTTLAREGTSGGLSLISDRNTTYFTSPVDPIVPNVALRTTLLNQSSCVRNLRVDTVFTLPNSPEAGEGMVRSFIFDILQGFWIREATLHAHFIHHLHHEQRFLQRHCGTFDLSIPNGTSCRAASASQWRPDAEYFSMCTWGSSPLIRISYPLGLGTDGMRTTSPWGTK